MTLQGSTLWIGLRALSFLVIAPGSILGLFPWYIAGSKLTGGQGTVMTRAVAAIVFAIGFAILLWCFADFVRRGRGTPAPYDPPRKLVTAGLYRYTRNPMYVALGIALVGEARWARSGPLAIYAAGVMAAFHLRVLIYEEPVLTRLFGDDYLAYRAQVPRWLIRFPRMRTS